MFSQSKAAHTLWMPQLRYCPPCKLPPCERKLINVVKWNQSVSTGLPKWGPSACFKKSRLIKEYLLYPSPPPSKRCMCLSRPGPQWGLIQSILGVPKKAWLSPSRRITFYWLCVSTRFILEVFWGRKRAWKKSLQLAKGILVLTLTNVCVKLIVYMAIFLL